MTTDVEEQKGDGGGKVEKKSYSCLIVFVVFFLLFVVFHIIPTQRYMFAHKRFYNCQMNCEKIGTQMRLYANSHQGHFPPDMASLCPIYLKSIPTCPGAKKDTYSASYQVFTPSQEGETDAYTFFCSGENHADRQVPPNYPQYNSKEGLKRQ